MKVVILQKGKCDIDKLLKIGGMTDSKCMELHKLDFPDFNPNIEDLQNLQA